MGKYPEIEEKMEKRINGYAGELKTIRAGRANASVLDKVAIDYYGTMTPVQQVGSISSPEPRLLVIQTAVKSAKDYITGALSDMLDLGKGSGPLNHMYKFYPNKK